MREEEEELVRGVSGVSCSGGAAFRLADREHMFEWSRRVYKQGAAPADWEKKRHMGTIWVIGL